MRAGDTENPCACHGYSAIHPKIMGLKESDEMEDSRATTRA